MVAGRQVDPGHAAELVPIEIIGAKRIEPFADRDDRPLSRRVEQRKRASCRVLAPRDVHSDTPPAQLLGGAPAISVVSERGVEVDLGPQLGQDSRHDAATAGCAREYAVGVDHLSRVG
jgi:hypothetical protein